MNNASNPARFHMPSEWQPQSAIWLAWPYNRETWPNNLEAAQSEFLKFIEAIAKTQMVFLMGSDPSRLSAKLQLGSLSQSARNNLQWVDIPTNDAWARDYAPTFVLDQAGKQVAIDWNYNCWGEKYPPFEDDQRVARRVANYLDIQHFSPSMCLEGGAVEVNDSGLLLTTRSCALNPNRNPERSAVQIESIFQDCLGIQHTIWIPGSALEGDDTDGHIDQLVRFTDDQTIVHAWTSRPDDPQRQSLELNRNELKSQLTAIDRDDIRLIPLPIPSPIELDDRRIPASYCNFLITNRLVLVPQFNQPEDAVALETLQALFPARTVIGLPSLNLSMGLGSFHCLSQHQPAADSQKKYSFNSNLVNQPK